MNNIGEHIRPADLIRKYYADSPQAWQILLEHSRLVTQKAVAIARRLTSENSVDVQFVAEAAMLHDIGMIRTRATDLGCFGEGSYLTHGVKGRELLEAEGWPRHALVCERHIGIGLTATEIKAQGLPLPARDMLPLSLEEQIICYADLFFSKDMKKRHKEKSPEKICRVLKKYGAEKVEVFRDWQQRFEPEHG